MKNIELIKSEKRRNKVAMRDTVAYDKLRQATLSQILKSEVPNMNLKISIAK